jgi:hypothetical protein
VSLISLNLFGGSRPRLASEADVVDAAVSRDPFGIAGSLVAERQSGNNRLFQWHITYRERPFIRLVSLWVGHTLKDAVVLDRGKRMTQTVTQRGNQLSHGISSLGRLAGKVDCLATLGKKKSKHKSK